MIKTKSLKLKLKLRRTGYLLSQEVTYSINDNNSSEFQTLGINLSRNQFIYNISIRVSYS